MTAARLKDPPAAGQEPGQPAVYRHNPSVFRAITAMTMGIQHILFVGHLITSDAFISYMKKKTDAYSCQYHGWLMIIRMLLFPYPVLSDQLTNPESLPKITVFYQDIPHLPWHVIQRSWVSKRAARIEMKNVRIALDKLWCLEYLSEAYPSLSTDPWMRGKYERLRDAKSERFYRPVSLEQRVFDVSVISFGEFLQEIFPGLDAQKMQALRAGLRDADQAEYGRNLRHIQQMTGYRHAHGIASDSGSASRLHLQHPIVLWFLYAWIVLR